MAVFNIERWEHGDAIRAALLLQKLDELISANEDQKADPDWERPIIGNRYPSLISICLQT